MGLANYLTTQGITVTVSGPSESAVAVACEQHDIPYRPQEFVPLPGNARRMRDTLRTVQPDVIHSASVFPLATALLARPQNDPVMFGAVNTDPRLKMEIPLPPWEKTKRRLRSITTRILSRHIDGIFATSMPTKKFLEKTGVRCEVSVFAESINTEAILSQSHHGMKLPKANTYIGTAAADLDNLKGLDYLIQALKLVRANHHEATLVIAGQGPNRNHLERVAAQLGLDEYVHFPGFVDELPKLLGHCSVWVLPSLSEGGRNVTVIEAMATKTPVVVSDLPSLKEVVDDGITGLVVPPANSEALGKAISNLLSDKEMASKLATAAFDLVNSDDYSSTYQFSKVLEVYKKPLNTKS